MDATPPMRWAGLAALLGGLVAVSMTLPFATAYFLAYPGYDTLPFWFEAVESRLEPLLTFASPETVYAAYGRVYNVAYLLFVPAVVALHRVYGPSSGRQERGSSP